MNQDLQQIFRQLVMSRAWGGGDSASGGGSSTPATARLRPEFVALLHKFDIWRLLDVPCGDCNWISRCWDSLEAYHGCDILEELLVVNRGRYPQHTFSCVDATTEQLPGGYECVLCRDLLGHLSHENAERVLQNIGNTAARYLLATTFPTRENRDCPDGDWRPINLFQPPYSLVPLYLINEQSEPHWPDKCLALFQLR